MITGKKKSKLKVIGIIAGCVVFCALAVFFAVMREKQISSSHLDDHQGHDHGELNDDSENSEENEVSLYRIIMPNGASSELAAKANSLALDINAVTDVHSVTLYDHEHTAEVDGCVEIILGKADRLEVTDALKGLRNTDFVCVKSAGSIVLGGVSEEGTFKAIEYFRENILPFATSFELLAEEREYRSVGEYPLALSRLNGYELYEYSVVYDGRNDGMLKDEAELLRDIINERSGYFLDVLPRSDFKKGKAIMLSSDSSEREDTASISCLGGNIILKGDSEFSVEYCIEQFADMLFERVFDGASEFEIADGTSRLFNVKNPQAVFSALKFTNTQRSNTQVISNVDDSIKNSGAHGVLTSPMSRELYERIVFSTAYRSVNVNVGEDAVFAIIYDAAKTSVSKGKTVNIGSAVILCAELAVAESGESYMMFNAWCPERGEVNAVASRISQLASESGLGFVAAIHTESYVGGVLIEGASDISDDIYNSGLLMFLDDRFSAVSHKLVNAEDESNSVNGKIVTVKRNRLKDF